MAWDYGFGELENELIEAGRECPPNYEKMSELLAAGADINAISSEEYAGKSIHFSNNFGKTPKDKYAAFFTI